MKDLFIVNQTVFQRRSSLFLRLGWIEMLIDQWFRK